MKLCGSCKGHGVELDFDGQPVQYGDICEKCNGEGIDTGVAFVQGAMSKRRKKFDDEKE